jgi:hypothetical protein
MILPAPRGGLLLDSNLLDLISQRRQVLRCEMMAKSSRSRDVSSHDIVAGN